MSAKLLILLVKIILQVALDNCDRPVADCIPDIFLIVVNRIIHRFCE